MADNLIYVNDIREAILKIIELNPKITKYRLAIDLNLSTSTHVANYINGVTKKCRPEVKLAIETKYNIRIEDGRNS